MLSNVRHLSLCDDHFQSLNFHGEFTGRLPIFHNLKTLDLCASVSQPRWDILLLEILTCSPSLQTLVFPMGLFDTLDINMIQEGIPDVLDLEEQVWKTTEVSLQCCQSSLRRIVIRRYFGLRRELNSQNFSKKGISSAGVGC